MKHKKINSEIGLIIYKYVELILKSFQENKEKKMLLENFYTTQTSMVPHDFFKGGNLLCEDNNVLLKEFDSPIILFNDLKNSTILLESFESLNLSCGYTAYILFFKNVRQNFRFT